MVFIDTNVFLYAIGKEHAYKLPSQSVLQALEQDKVEGNTNTEVIQEVLYVLSRRGSRELASEVARDLIDLFPNLLPVTRPDLMVAAILYTNSPSISPRDAVHVATMRNNGLDTIVTADLGFDNIDGIRRVDPTAI